MDEAGHIRSVSGDKYVAMARVLDCFVSSEKAHVLAEAEMARKGWKCIEIEVETDTDPPQPRPRA